MAKPRLRGTALALVAIRSGTNEPGAHDASGNRRETGASTATVCRDLAWIREKWRKSAVEDFEEARAIELTRLNMVERKSAVVRPVVGSQSGVRSPCRRVRRAKRRGEPARIMRPHCTPCIALRAVRSPCRGVHLAKKRGEGARITRPHCTPCIALRAVRSSCRRVHRAKKRGEGARITRPHCTPCIALRTMRPPPWVSRSLTSCAAKGGCPLRPRAKSATHNYGSAAPRWRRIVRQVSGRSESGWM